MAEVTRRVIIEVETRQKKSRLDAPDVGSAERGFKAEAEAADKASKAVEKATESTKRHSEQAKKSTDVWAAGLKQVSREFREQEAGTKAWQAGLERLRQQGITPAAESTHQLQQTVTRSSQEIVRDFREAGEGAFRM